MLSDQLVMLPMSPPRSSRSQSVQVPFGASPSKVDRLTFADWVGAGAGKPSAASGQLAGRQEPEVIAVASGSWLAASSSSTRLPPTIPFAPPASDITVAFVAGVGWASMMSMSSVYVCEMPLIDMLTSVIVPLSPETTQFEG
jgi:hypothetical protein